MRFLSICPHSAFAKHAAKLRIFSGKNARFLKENQLMPKNQSPTVNATKLRLFFEEAGLWAVKVSFCPGFAVLLVIGRALIFRGGIR